MSKKIKRIIKSLLATSLLVTGFIMNPVNTKAALGEPEVETQAVAHSISFNNREVWVVVNGNGHGGNYYPIKLNGSFVHNTSGSNYYITNNNLSVTATSDFSYAYANYNKVGIYEVTSFLVTSYAATSNLGLKINFKAYLKLSGGGNLGYCTGTITVR